MFQIPASAVRQKIQAIVKQACRHAGIEVELRTVLPSVYYSSDPGNPDTLGRFQADLQMHAVNTEGPIPSASWRRSRPGTWPRERTSGRGGTGAAGVTTATIGSTPAAKHEMDPVKRAALFIQMNDLVIREAVVIPIVWRSWAVAMARTLRNVVISPWDSIFFNVADWHRET